MNNYDDLLREKENNDLFNDSSMEKHWKALEKKIDTHPKHPQTKYRKLFRSVVAIAAVSILIFLGYTFFKQKKLQPNELIATLGTKSAIIPPLKGADVPYEIFSFNAAMGDTIFTLNGSIIIFPKNALLNAKGEIVNGNIEVRTREFNDVFDYSIAGIPMEYDSAGVKYQFISSGMIDIVAYQNGEPLQVNPDAKPQLNLASTNKERKTNLYKLDTVTGKWMNKGIDEVNLVGLKNTRSYVIGDAVLPDDTGNGDADYFNEAIPETAPAPPQKASNVNPLIDVSVDPASFKELLVYDGLKFEVIDANAEKVEEDSKTEWDNIELVRGEASGTYKAIFSAKNKKVTYNVKPVLEGKDFAVAEKLYQEKLKEYKKIQSERKKSEENDQKSLAQKNLEQQKENKRIEELNKLIASRNKYIEAENIRIDALNKANQRRIDSAIKANEEFKGRQKMADLEQNLIRSFQIDGFGYWNCDMPTMPATQPYVVSFKTLRSEVVTYNTLCIATHSVNRIQNYYNTNRIGLINNSSYFGWAFNATQFYYFTRINFEDAVRSNNTITISMNLYEGDVKNYEELKAYIFNVNNSNDISKK